MVVCTANQCRSPMAERLAMQILAERGVEAAVISRGVSAEPGIPATRGAIRALARRGLDLADHVSRPVGPEELAWADLVIAMERRHLSRIAEVELGSIHRSFTLIELRKLLDAVGIRMDGESVADWVELADQRRDPMRVLGGSREDDVKDPMGGWARGYRTCATLLEESLRDIFGHLFPPD